MRMTQGTFSFLPDLSDDQIERQIEYCLRRGFAINIEYTDEPHPRNTYWELWNMPMFDETVVPAVLKEIQACRETYPQHYVRVNAYNSERGIESVALSFIVNRPTKEPGFRLIRQDSHGRNTRYTLESYASHAPEGERYSRSPSKS
jgi:ribulose-bisphosphate carboxylase small chain